MRVVAVAVLLLWWTFFSQVNFIAISLWAALMVSVLRLSYLHAHNNLRKGITPQRAPLVVKRLVLERIFYGTGWGFFGFFTLGEGSANSNLLVLAAIAGMTSGAMSAFAPVLLLFAVTVVPTVTLITLKVSLLDDPSFHVLGVTFVLYMVVLLGQAFHSSKQAHAAIDLRFENIDLLDQLHAETKVAQTARQEAEDANAAKSKFLAAASHDLRQPIHAQGLFLEVLSHTGLNDHQRELLASAELARESTAEMLNTLLDFSRLEAGVIEPQMQAFGVQALLNKIEREFVQQADAKGLDYRSRESTLVLQSDPALIELILRNLVSNAIKYTARGGLLVTCRASAGAALLEVWDTGIGIDLAEQAEVFREFAQLGNTERDRNKGLGLGLAIVKGLSGALGHGLSLRSVPGRGSVFRLQVPTASVLPAPQPLVSEPRLAGPLALRVLVVDDDVQVRTGMQHLLRNWGCECLVAQDVEEALALAVSAERHLDLLICDYRLGELRTGIQAVAAIRACTRATLPALLITADTAPDRLREATASGIPLLHKPVATEQLYRSLAKVRPEER